MTGLEIVLSCVLGLVALSLWAAWSKIREMDEFVRNHTHNNFDLAKRDHEHKYTYADACHDHPRYIERKEFLDEIEKVKLKMKIELMELERNDHT